MWLRAQHLSYGQRHSQEEALRFMGNHTLHIHEVR